MDVIFTVGVGAVLSGIIVFVGSTWLLLSLILGPRLAYFVAASITLAFLLIMSVAWSVNPLGPVGELPSWGPVAIGEDPSGLEFGPADSYPESPWRVPNEDDTAEQTQKSELETDAGAYVETAVTEGDLDVPAGSTGIASTDETRFLEQDGDLFGAVTLEVAPPAGAAPRQTEGGTPEPIEVVAILEFDPGNPLGRARIAAVGAFVLLVLHLFGLSRSERRARREAEAERGPE
ncbi:MAG: hypothetical protein ACRDJS_04125 [Actinomycetota bacterium]